MTTINTSTATTSELVAFYNQHAGDKPIKKFRDRATAEARVNKLLSERQFVKPTPLPDTDVMDSQDQCNLNVFGAVNCPACGISLRNGVGEHLQEVNGKPVKHEKFQFECLACGVEFGPEISKATNNKTGELRPATSASLKLDRTIACNVTEETWANAYAMWKQNPEWMSSGQQDRLTATLYKAAKQGEKLTLTINGRSFWLVNVGSVK